MKLRRFKPGHQKNSLFFKTLIAVGAFMAASLILAGSIIITKAISVSETEFKAEKVEQKEVEPEKQKRKVIVKNTQKRNKSLVKRIKIEQQQHVNTPPVQISLPSGMGGEGTDGFANVDVSDMSNLGKIKIELPEFDLFGIKGSSDRVLICFDVCSKTMTDEMGALPAFNVVKNEISTLVRGLPSTCLFNVMCFDMERGQHGDGTINCVEIFRQNLVPANSANKSGFEAWMKGINEDENRVGIREDNYKLRFPYVPFNEGFAYHATTKKWGWRNHVWERHAVVFWYMAYQAAIEQGAGVIYFLTTHWPLPEEYWLPMSDKQREKYIADTKKNADDFQKKGGVLVTPEEKGKFYAIARARAREMINKENEIRRSKNQPPMVVRDSWGYAAAKKIPEAIEAMKKKTWDDFPPLLQNPKAHTTSSLMAAYEPIFKKLYDEKGLARPVFNMIIMLPRKGDPEWQKKYFKNASIWARQNNKGSVRILRGAKPFSEYEDPDTRKTAKKEDDSKGSSKQ
ncbi:MAG: hypothetical protein J6T16_07735 [Opitutales bacterium]|nr:hypothetical protein [Opitutales bacterium]